MKQINFKVDEGKHKEVIDWWYFNGILKGKNENFSYMTCLFKMNPKEAPIIKSLPGFAKNKVGELFSSHNVITNLKTGETIKHVHDIVRISDDSFTRPLLFVDYSPIYPIKTKYESYEIKEKHPFDYVIKTPVLDIDLKSTKIPLLEDNKGFFKYKNYYTYYYSLTNLKTNGLLKWKNKWINVKGKSWHDHQWMNKVYFGEIWDWFSIQLENNEELVCGRLRDRNGKKWGYFATKIDNDGKMKSTHNLEFIPSNYWTSKKTKLKYPIEWRIKIKDWKMEITAKACNKNQEMIFGPIKYWEGPLQYELNRKKITGCGFGEFVGRKED